MKKIPKAARLRDDPIQASKRLFFLVTTPVGVVCLVIIWGLGYYFNEIAWLDRFTLPIMAGILLVLFLLILPRLLSLKVFEFCVYSLVFVYFNTKYYTVLHSALLSGTTIDSRFFLWIPFVYIIGFMMLAQREALIGSLSFFFISLMLGIVYLAQSWRIGIQPNNLRLLIEFTLASMFFIVVLHLMSRIREHYVTAQVMADLMARLAMTDTVTQVDNRRRLEQNLMEEVKRADRHHLPLAVIMFDIDNFKRINDRRGHAIGDQVLMKSAKLVRDSLRSSDHFGRWGGDEFLCVATNTDEDTAVRLADRLRKALESAAILDGSPVTASFGVTRFARGDSPEVLVRRADVGLLRAKDTGRNRVEYIPPESTLPV